MYTVVTNSSPKENIMKIGNTIWDKSVCSHSGNGVKALSQVFQVKDGQFAIEPEKAGEEQIRLVAVACPSKALRME